MAKKKSCDKQHISQASTSPPGLGWKRSKCIAFLLRLLLPIQRACKNRMEILYQSHFGQLHGYDVGPTKLNFRLANERYTQHTYIETSTTPKIWRAHSKTITRKMARIYFTAGKHLCNTFTVFNALWIGYSSLLHVVITLAASSSSSSSSLSLLSHDYY